MRSMMAAGAFVLVQVALAACASKAAEKTHADDPHAATPERDFAGTETAPDPTTAICGEVRIKPELAAKVTPHSVLFVFAKPQAGGGAPAAVVRREGPAFPAKFCLSQKNAMAPGVMFSGTQFITARVEFDTSAGGQPGDLETVTKEPVSVGTSDLVLTIDTVRP